MRMNQCYEQTPIPSMEPDGASGRQIKYQYFGQLAMGQL